MNTNKRYNLLQGALKATLCLALLVAPTLSFAQEQGKGKPAAEKAAKTSKKSKGQGAAAAPKTMKAKKAPAQPTYEMKIVSGHVYDAATQKPIPGVRLTAFGNSGYTAITDDDGAYTIKVPVFTTSLYVATDGYNAAQVAFKGNDTTDVWLLSGAKQEFYSKKTSIAVRDVMSVTESSALTVEDDMQTYLASSLRTISRGGMPAQGAALFINGINSLNANSMPLIVIDGVEQDMQYDRETLHDGFVTNALSIIDPNDIESVEVLKNGTARYGARGGNGVILINTKRGKSMATRINVRAYGGFTQSPEQMKMMDAGQYRSYVSELLGTQPNISEKMTSLKRPNFLNEDPGYFYYPLFHNETDWQKDLYHNVFTQNYRISVEGGDDVAMYNLSLGYTQADATAKSNDFNRLNIRFNTDVNLFKGLVAGLDISYVRNAYNLRDNGWASDYSQRNISSPNVLGMIQSPFVSKYAHAVKYNLPIDGQPGSLQLVASDHVYSGKKYEDSNNPFRFAENYGFSALVNPYWILENGQGNNKNSHEQTQFNLNAAPSYTVNRYLTISDRFSYILNRTNEKYYLPINGTPEKFVEGLGNVSSVVRSQFAKLTTLYNDFNVDWHRQYAAHNVHVMGGFRIASYSYSDSRVTGYNNDQDKMPNMAYSLDYKQYGGTKDNWLNLLYYVQADYNFQQKYFATVGLSAESSSRFGRDAHKGGNNFAMKLAGVPWALFPTVQGAWVVSNEDWFRAKRIDFLKLNLGFEMSGNDNLDYYASRTYFENAQFLDKATSLVIANIQNPSIQWETTNRFNIGVQGSFFKNRLTASFEAFFAKTKNLLTRRSISDITGLPSMWTNGGELKNKGFEVSLSAMAITHRDWRWQLGVSAGHYKNEITQLPNSNLTTIKTYALDENGRRTGEPNVITGYTSGIYGTNNVLTAVGHSAGVFYGYQTAGVFATDEEAGQASDKYGYLRYPTGLASQPYRNFRAGDVHFVDQNGDGWINEADMVEIGNPNPTLYGNLWTSLSWKSLTLDIAFKYSLGNDVFNFQRQQLESGNNVWNQTTAVVNRWRYDGQQTEIPRACATTSDYWVNNERFSDRWIEDGSYLKLRNIRLTYRIPINLSWLLGLSVWGEANNVVTFTKYTGQDPEVTAGNGVLYQGIDCGLLPLSRNFNLGVTINL